MITINGKEFENLGITLSDTNAVLNIPVTEGFAELEDDLRNAAGKFTIEETEYNGFTKIVAVQKSYSANIGETNEIYTIVLECEQTVAEILTGKDLSAGEAVLMRKEIEDMSTFLPDESAENHVWAFKRWSGNAVNYEEGDRVAYEELLYKCLLSHVSQEDWSPDKAVSLWVRVDDPAEEFPEWRQPTGAHDAYELGAKVSHNEKHWISTIDSNTYEPGVYGWAEEEA